MVAVDNCDVCIVGAGLAGMNALFVVGQYLKPEQKVILLDRRPRVGGMWVDTYPYVRLHQPHPMFTAGDIAWTLGRERSYLATRDEVLDHFEHCLNHIRRRIQVDVRFGWTFESDSELDESGVRISCRDETGAERIIEADRLIKAYGLRVTPKEPLPVSSARVRSVSPNSCDVRHGAIGDSDAPVWIIGSGKTAMDTAHTLITARPGREVNMVAGTGTFFANREQFFPSGFRRYWSGTPVSALAPQLSRHFDGTNEEQTLRWLHAAYGTGPCAQAGHYMVGVLSEAENRTITAGLKHVVMDHLEDVVDRDDGTELVLRSGATRAIRPDSWLVNCTGYLVGADVPYEPYTSPSGRVLSLQPRSMTLHLTSYTGYFMTHLMFLDQLNTLPLYAVDLQELANRSKSALPCVMFALVQYNLSLIYDAVPTKVFTGCGLDFDRWYPWHRRMLRTVQFLRTHHAQRERVRQTLDTVAGRFDIRCAPLESVLRACAGAAG
ncbi:FAD-dependent oxidoreductase [Mycobacterium sp. NPDC003323]